MRTRHAPRTAEALALARRREDARRLAAVARIEAALPAVRAIHRGVLSAAVASANELPAYHLERLAGMAETYLQTAPDQDAEARQQRAAQLRRELFGAMSGRRERLDP